MATRIRLRRMGRKKHPTYRMVVADIAAPRDGKYLEAIGYYEPQCDPAVIRVDREKALKWLAEGATPSDTVKSLMKKAGVFSPAPAVEPAVVAVAAPAASAEEIAETPDAAQASEEAAGQPDSTEEATEQPGAAEATED